MLKRTKRQIYCYDVVVSARAAHAHPPSLREVMEVLKAMWEANDCAHERDGGTMVYRIGDVEIDDQAHVAKLLIRRCDLEAANAVYSHSKTGKSRVAEREPDEGGDRAAHAVVSLLEEAGKPHTYLCHIEGVTGLSHRLIQAMLNAILRRAIQTKRGVFEYDDPSGAMTRDRRPKKHPFVPSIQLYGHPSLDFIKELEAGTVKSITLVDQRAASSLGGSAYLDETGRFSHIKVSPAIPQKGRFEHIMKQVGLRATEYQKARINFTDTDGNSRIYAYDIETGNPEQDRYIKYYTVSGIDPPLDESAIKIVPHLTERITIRVLAERSS